MPGVWLARLLTDMIIMQSWSLELFVDHESAIAMSKNSVFHDRSKHARFHFIRDYIEEGRIKLSYTSSEKTCSHKVSLGECVSRSCMMRSASSALVAVRRLRERNVDYSYA
jgi:hypothetical protein